MKISLRSAFAHSPALGLKTLARKVGFGIAVFLIVSPAILVFLWMLSLSLKNELDNTSYPPVFWPSEPAWYNYVTIFEQNVRGLDVAVRDADSVRGRERIRDPSTDRDCFGDGQRARGESPGERLAREAIHDEVTRGAVLSVRDVEAARAAWPPALAALPVTFVADAATPPRGVDE